MNKTQIKENKSDNIKELRKSDLSRLKKLVSNNYRVMPGGDNLTSKGYLVPIGDLIKI